MKTTGFVVILSLSFLTLTTSIAQPIRQTATHSVSSIQKINLNTAASEQLIHAFRGIGPKRIEAIIAYRQQHGRFKSLTELAEVKGIGQSFVAQHLSELQNRFSVE